MLILIDRCYLRNFVFSIAKGWKGQYHSSSNLLTPVKNFLLSNISSPPVQGRISYNSFTWGILPPLNAIWKTLMADPMVHRRQEKHVVVSS